MTQPEYEAGRTLLARSPDGVLPPDLRASMRGRLRLDATWRGFPLAEILELDPVPHHEVVETGEVDEDGEPIFKTTDKIRYYHHILGWYLKRDQDEDEAADDDAA